MLTIVPRPSETAPIDLAGVQALVFTSANGVRVFAQRCPRRDLPAFTVGAATAREAANRGFDHVHSADGDVSALARLIVDRLSPQAGALFQPAASATAGDLKSDLEQARFCLRRIVLYDAEPARELPPPVIAALRNKQVDAVMLFSPRTGAAFVRLMEEAGLTHEAKFVLALCLSPAVEAKIGQLSWKGIKVAAAPNQNALLACLD